jgi:hypothetical protein
MRIWHLPYSYLDGQRLLSQHTEVHGLGTCIAKGRQWGSITAQFADKTAYLTLTHEKCVAELAVRSGRDQDEYLATHPSPFDTTRFDPGSYHSYRPTREDLTTDVLQLRDKWEKERYYFGMGRKDLRVAEGRLGLPPGRSPEDCLRLKTQCRETVRRHRTELKAMGDLRLGQKLERLKEAHPHDFE